MSKYGNLREQAGHCQVFLTRTATCHDATMEHPLMQSIYDKRITRRAYRHYLCCLLPIFEAMETEDATAHVLPASLVDARLYRADAIREDIARLDELGSDDDAGDSGGDGGGGGGGGGLSSTSAAVTAYFSELLTDAKRKSHDDMICHHFLHYNAMLSGGTFLGSCLRQMGWPNALYAFDLGEDSSTGKPMRGHAYVRRYMTRLDALPLSSASVEVMVGTMRRVYALTECIMDEAQAMQPKVQRGLAVKNGAAGAATEDPAAVAAAVAPPQLFDSVVTLDELHRRRGGEPGRPQMLWISVGGRVLDATGSSSYAPDGPYECFAGHDITRCLATMSLDDGHLDDLRFSSAACATWAKKLGRVYRCVGTLAEYPPANRLDEALFAYDPAAPSLAAVPQADGESASTADDERNDGSPKSSSRCPLTGQSGASCPLGFGKPNSNPSKPNADPAPFAAAEGVAGAGECPFPFILLHDPVRGWALHRQKVIWLLAACAVLVFSYVLQRAGAASSKQEQ